MKRSKTIASAILCCAVSAMPFTSWAMTASAVSYPEPVMVSVDTENDYFGVSDDGFVTAKQSGYYLAVYTVTPEESGDTKTYYTTYVDGAEFMDYSLDTLMDSVLPRVASANVGDVVGDAYGAGYLLMYGDDTTEFDVCYSIAPREQATTPEVNFDPYMRYRLDETELGNGYVVYEFQTKIDTENYEVNGGIENTVVTPNAGLSFTEVRVMNSDGEALDYELSGFSIDTSAQTAEFEVKFYKNDTFTVEAYATTGEYCFANIEVTEIEGGITPDDTIDFGDVEKPVLTIDIDNSKTYEVGDVCPVTITSNEPVIFIVDGEQFGTLDARVTSCVYNATYSGTFNVIATDASDNSRRTKFTVDVFDKSEEAIKGDNGNNESNRDNPINDSNRNDYWQITNLGSTGTAGSGTGSGNPYLGGSSNSLPQTGLFGMSKMAEAVSFGSVGAVSYTDPVTTSNSLKSQSQSPLLNRSKN